MSVPQRVVPFQAEEGLAPGLGRKEGIPEQLGQADSQHLFPFLPLLLHLGNEVPPHWFLGPGLVVERKQLVSPPQDAQSHQ